MSSGALTLQLQGLTLELPDSDSPFGTRALIGLMQLANRTLSQLQDHITAGTLPQRLAAVGRVRGTGPGASLGSCVHAIEECHPIELESPFEGSHSIAGRAWEQPGGDGAPSQSRLVKLQFSQGTVDLPLHVHEHSDRFIIVFEGRGVFHLSASGLEEFNGSGIRSVPIRSRDVLIFTQGVLHTFSTPTERMVLLSYQSPFIPFDDPRQYTIPELFWMPSEVEKTGQVACDPAWSVLLG